jgi:ABC-type glutathione transport system ATPase component
VTAGGLELQRIVRRFGRAGRAVSALAGVDLQVRPGEIVGLVGESGSGKTTLARIATGLDRPDAGSVRLDGQPLLAASGGVARHVRGRIQMVFQDPLASFNPARRIGGALALPLRLQRRCERRRLAAAIAELLSAVGLDPALAARRPDELSGGQLQRAAIARALATEPSILVCDEPVASLDVTVRAQVLNLLVRLKRSRGLGTLFISHDLGVVRRLADRTIVLRAGSVVEEGAGDALWRAPTHPYTRALVAAVPTGLVPWREQRRQRTAEPWTPPRGD